MKYFFLLLTIGLFASCKQTSKPPLVQKFTIIQKSISSTETIESVYFFRNTYLCFAHSKKIICLNGQFDEDTTLGILINRKKFDFYFSSKDSIIAGYYDKGIYLLDSNFEWKPIRINSIDDIMYEDDSFSVRALCAGEFGGSIFFTDKKTKKVYSCPATCAVSVNKIGKDYFVTNSLAHITGSTDVIKITNPLQLYEIKSDSFLHHANWYMSHSINKDGYEGVERFKKGSTKIFNTIGVMTLITFNLNSVLYHINSDRSKTFISKIEGDTLVMIDSIINKALYDNHQGNKKYGAMYLHQFDNGDLSGFLTVIKDTIKVVYFSTETLQFKMPQRAPQKSN